MMAGKAGGRLTLEGRKDYEPKPVYDSTREQPRLLLGYAAQCACRGALHYLVMTPDGRVTEHLAQPGTMPYPHATMADAQAAIEAWQRQHAAATAESGETTESEAH